MKSRQGVKQDIQFQETVSSDPRRNTFKEDWRSEWEHDLDVLLKHIEASEQALSTPTFELSGRTRKQNGAYYTPVDVARFFWNEYMALTGIATAEQAAQFLQEHHVIEPSCGSGILWFTLMEKCVATGLSPEDLSDLKATLIDTNSEVLDYVRVEFCTLARKWGISLKNVKFIASDFLEFSPSDTGRKLLYFGNPPYVTNPSGCRWKNLYADFVEKAVNDCGPEGKVHFILPLSIAFSRDYQHLRIQLKSTGKSIALSNFDNIPDTLFSSGKPENTNTNKANSQRCTILTVFPAKEPKVISTCMHRWQKRDRTRLLTTRPQYRDVTNYSLDNQFPRPESCAFMNYLDGARHQPKFMSLICRVQLHTINVAGVARNFVGFREEPSSSAHQICFTSSQDQLAALMILSSDIFLDYWRTIGDGFHLTSSNILNFPLHPNLMDRIRKNLRLGQKMWDERENFAKSKSHPKGVTVSYDFTPVALKLLPEFESASG